MNEPREVFLFYAPKAEFCPARLLVDFLDFCKDHDQISGGSYVFQNLNRGISFGGTSFTSAAANARLRLYLKLLNLWDGETPHGTRSACAIMLSHLGIEKDAIKAHVGWKTDQMFEHYTSSKSLRDKKNAAETLSMSGMPVGLNPLNDLYKDPKSFTKVFI